MGRGREDGLFRGLSGACGQLRGCEVDQRKEAPVVELFGRANPFADWHLEVVLATGAAHPTHLLLAFWLAVALGVAGFCSTRWLVRWWKTPPCVPYVAPPPEPPPPTKKERVERLIETTIENVELILAVDIDQHMTGALVDEQKADFGKKLRKELS